MKFRLVRVLTGIPVLVSIALLTPASAHAPATASRTCSSSSASSSSSPSQLDYLVLASFADSANMLGMSAYRTAHSE